MNIDIKLICETLKRTRMIRKGKLKIKYVTDKENYKVLYNPKSGQAKEVRMSQTEIRKRHLAGIKRARSMKGKKSQISQRRKMSMMKRSGW